MGKKELVANRQYTDEFKVEAVKLGESIGANQAAKRLGIAQSSLWNWIKLNRASKLKAAVGAPVALKQSGLVRFQRLAHSWIETEICRLLAYKQVTEVMRTGAPGPEGSYLKLVWSETDQRMKELAIEVEGPYAALARGSARALDEGRWEYEYLWSRAATIYAGTSEVQRNVIAQRVLGLPRGF